MIDRDRADRIRDLFGELADLSAAERAAHLTAACGEDAALRRELESLLGAADAPDFVPPVLHSIQPIGPDIDRPDAGIDVTALERLPGDRYRIEREIGRGGMATVYLAMDRKHHRSVALKVLDPELSKTLGSRRFLREIEIAASLRHPNILPLFDSGEADVLLYYVMPYIEGGSLRQRLDRERQLPVEDAVRITCEIAEALACAHERGVIHRDVKPGNILLDGEHAVLADFGIASALAETDRATLTGSHPGTPAYMSPEQMAGDRSVDHRSDQFALACVLYEMLAGSLPLRGTDAHHLADVRPDVPSGVTTAMARGLAPDPGDRFPGTAEFATALTHGLRLRSVSRRTRAALWVAAAAATVALASLLLARVGAGNVDDRRVAIVPFVNRTGSDSLDPFGAVLAEVVSDRLGRTGLADVVPTASVGAALAMSGSQPGSVDPGGVRDLTGAGFIIQGSYFMVNDSLGIQPQIIEVTERASLAPIELVIVPVADLQRGIRLVLERVQVALAGRLNPLLAQAGRTSRLPISMDAYTTYVTGLEKYQSGDYASALEYMYRAAELDSTSMSALIWAAVIEWNATGNLPATDSLLRTVERRRGELLPFDAAQLDWLRAYLDGDLPAAGDAARRRADLGGRTFAGATVQVAIYTNRLDRAFTGISRLLEMPHLADKATPRQFLATILHARGDHGRELREVRNAIEVSGDRNVMLRSEMRALAALGRTRELRDLLEYFTALPYNDLEADIFREAAAELRAHGWFDDAGAIGRLAVEYYERIIAESNAWTARFELAATLAELGGADRDRARALFEALHHEGLRLPFSWPHALRRDVAILGYLGTIAAAEGNATRAENQILALDSVDRPYLFGSREFWQARIAATLGQCVRAVRFLETATRNGQTYHDLPGSVSIRELPEFMTLHERGCNAYERFIRPK